MTATATAPDRPATRIPALDVARTVAILCMVVFHFTVDLQDFGLIPPGTVFNGFWPYFARGIAGSFLFLSGVSLWLAYGRGLRARHWLGRFAMIAGGAAAVTAGTRLAVPQAFVFFGILHMMAAASVIGLLFLRLPAPVTLVAAAGAFVAQWYLRMPAFDAPWLLWLGLQTYVPRSIDYVPVLPWIAPYLAGLAAARIAAHSGALDRLRVAGPGGRMARALGWPGRHGLAVYLIHQPVLIAVLTLATRL